MNALSMVVYWRRPVIQRWNGMMMAMMSSVRLARTTALPYWAGTSSRTSR